MATTRTTDSKTDLMAEAIATATRAAKVAGDAAQIAADEATGNATMFSKTVGPATQQFVEQTTESVGKFVTPIVENPVVKFAGKLPGINLLFAALGQVDTTKAQQEVDKLRQQYPGDTPEQIAQRIMMDTAMKAGGIGLLTNFIPPVALALFAVDIAAVTVLQAEMIYRIAAAYNFPLNDPTRRGEVLTIFGLSIGGSGALKLGLSFVELIPGFGAMVGASSDAALLYGLGYLACRFYEGKRQAIASPF